MEITNGLLVAMMFIVIITIGIGNVLMAIAGTVEKGWSRKEDGMHTSWVLLVLLAHFSLFWHTLDLLDVETWSFFGFLFVVTGPILLFLTTSILISPGGGESRRNEHYYAVRRSFFTWLVLLQLWFIGIDFVLRGELIGSTVLNGFALFVALSLRATAKESHHLLGTSVMWVLFVTGIVLRGTGTIV